MCADAESRTLSDLAEMLGLAKSILSDGVVSEEEAGLLMKWTDDHPDVVMGWPGNVLYRRLRKIFDDGHASEAEREDLRELLEAVVVGAVATQSESAPLPFNDPPQPIEITDRTFVFTGRFAFGARGVCEEAVRRIGGWVEPSLTPYTDYLVVGTFPSRDWPKAGYGRKLTEAVQSRDKCSMPVIISERHWVAHL